MANVHTTHLISLIGSIITRIDGAEQNSEVLSFTFRNGDIFQMFHDQDCCEDVRIEDVGGDITDLLDSPLVLAEEVTNEGETDWGTCTWTWYRFATIKGYVTIRWLGESNGYYSEKVDHKWIRKQ